MKQIVGYFLIVLLVISSCKSNNKSQLNPENLKSSFISINPAQAYVLKTGKGAWLKIAANTFNAAPGEMVNLELKEAYTLQDILAAGLTTTSNGKPLKTAGMVYFNATANGRQLDFLKPVEITTPANNWDSQMQLFTGEWDDKGRLNWVEPNALDSSPLVKNLLDGKALFKAHCASCHKPTADFTGPMLAGSRSRAPYPGWPYLFVNNLNGMLETDAYAKKLFQQWGSKMTQFNLPYQDIKAIFDYCDNEWALKQANSQTNPQPTTVPLPGATDTLQMPAFDNSELQQDCGYDTIPVLNTAVDSMPIDSQMPDSFIDNNTNPIPMPVYNFQIEKNGWYNIDAFYNNNTSLLTPVQLTVQAGQNQKPSTDVYLIIPSKKIFTHGYLNKDYYYFDNEDGSINLELGDEAIIFMLGQKDEQLFAGIQQFVIEEKQALQVALKPMSKDDILLAIKKNNLDGVKIDIKKYIIESIITVPQADSMDTHSTDSSIVEMEVIKKTCPEKYIKQVYQNKP